MKTYYSINALLYSILFLISISSFQLSAQSTNTILGKIDFPTSGNGEAQKSFETGVLALHSFWYEEARDHFNKAQRIDPQFAMAYWGEAMTYAGPFWGPGETIDSLAGKKVLKKVDSIRSNTGLKWTDREKMYVDAVRLLFRGGDNLEAHREPYLEAMNLLVEKYPEDDEAVIFTALARMCLPDFDDQNPFHVVEIAAPLENIYERKKDHPGVLHYLIHVYDTPMFGEMGLRQARIYADLAPSASHALHMPSHIFKHMGQWDKVIASNIDSYNASVKWQKRTKRPVTSRDFHALDWLHETELEIGHFKHAAKYKDSLKNVIAEAKQENLNLGMLPMMLKSYENAELGAMEWAGMEVKTEPVTMKEIDEMPTSPELFNPAYRAARHGQKEIMDTIIARLNKFELPPNMQQYRASFDNALSNIKAEYYLTIGESEKALEMAEKAMEYADEKDKSDPQKNSKFTEYARFLYEGGKIKEAYDIYAELNDFFPKRVNFLIGLARSSDALGRKDEAVRYYQDFLEIWNTADEGIPIYKEAKNYVEQNKTTSK
ncbi:type IV pilus biogenesis/stability protein PilW [Gramella sp. KN1008]|uniref:tetratricopeptide repeat protein n=1 Tax=Gramella sp. KN1008 TaxID=2529298 RepID=UPI00103D7BE4|nr:hypothetical protein [Gramella sp. KN1008]TBW28692.1 hypothetical protein EZJ28_08135 [Gramella sp. KN1008]